MSKIIGIEQRMLPVYLESIRDDIQELVNNMNKMNARSNTFSGKRKNKKSFYLEIGNPLGLLDSTREKLVDSLLLLAEENIDKKLQNIIGSISEFLLSLSEDTLHTMKMLNNEPNLHKDEIPFKYVVDNFEINLESINRLIKEWKAL